MNDEEKKVLELLRMANELMGCILDDKQANIILNLIEKLQKENTELKEDNSHQWEERCRLTFELERLQKENKELKGKNKYQYELLGKFEEHIDKETIMKIYDEGEEND